MLKVMTVVGTRPELIKMSRVIAALDRHTEHLLVHTGQNFDYELNEVFFNDLGVRKPDYFLEAAGSNPAQTIAQVVWKSDEVFEKEMPDAVMLYGDTNSCLAILAAKRRKIPVFHMEAGNRCFDQRVPEELNRKVLDHLSDINFVLTEHARRYLLAEGIRPETIIKTGSHMREVLNHYMPRILESDVLSRLGLGVGEYFIGSFHREENVDCPDGLRDLLDSLNALVEEFEFPVIVSTHPRTQKRLADVRGKWLNERIVFSKPFGFHDYIRLQRTARCVLSDSGTLTEEAALLNLPAVMIRNAHERPEGMEEAAVMMTGMNTERVMQGLAILEDQPSGDERLLRLVSDYGIPNVSDKVLRIIHSYTDYVNRVVWKRY